MYRILLLISVHKNIDLRIVHKAIDLLIINQKNRNTLYLLDFLTFFKPLECNNDVVIHIDLLNKIYAYKSIMSYQ